MDHTNSYKLFPRVVLLNIYYHLDIKSLFSCSLVNKHFSKLFDNDTLWDKLIGDHYSQHYIDAIKVNYNIDKSKLIYKTISNLLSINKLCNPRRTLFELIILRKLHINPGKITVLPQSVVSLINLK